MCGQNHLEPYSKRGLAFLHQYARFGFGLWVNVGSPASRQIDPVRPQDTFADHLVPARYKTPTSYFPNITLARRELDIIVVELIGQRFSSVSRKGNATSVHQRTVRTFVAILWAHIESPNAQRMDCPPQLRQDQSKRIWISDAMRSWIGGRPSLYRKPKTPLLCDHCHMILL